MFRYSAFGLSIHLGGWSGSDAEKDQADHEGKGPPVELTDLDLRSDDRELRKHGALDRVLRADVALQHEPEDRHEHEQQGEQREERVVRHERREVPRLVIAELLDHRNRDRERRVALLLTIEGSYRA